MSASMRVVRSLIAVFTVFLVSMSALAQEWKEVTQDEARLTFVIPTMENHDVIFRHSTWESNQEMYEQSIWLNRKNFNSPLAMIFGMLSFGDTFMRGSLKLDQEKFVEESGIFADKRIDWGEKGSTANQLGQVKFTRFSWVGRNCFSFSQKFGDVSADNVVAASQHALLGFYCDGPATTVAEEQVGNVLNSIRFRDFKSTSY